MGAKPCSVNIAFLIAMFVGAHSTTNTVLVTRKLPRHCVLTEIDVGTRFVMGLYSSLRNVWCMMWGNKTTHCLVLSRQNSFYMSCCMYVTLNGLRTNIGMLYNVRLTSQLFRKQTMMSLKLKVHRDTIKLVCYKLFMWLSLSSIVQLSHG
jgi:hypothetical protein